jgi:predicted nucleic acid-binding protein
VAAGLRILVDSSVWIDILRVNPAWPAERAAELLGTQNVILADLVLVEVARGLSSRAQMKLLLARFSAFEQIAITSMDIARKAIRNHLSLSEKGITVRGTVDLLLATWCIENDVPLLHADRDFEGFEIHLGLKRWRPLA